MHSTASGKDVKQPNRGLNIRGNRVIRSVEYLKENDMKRLHFGVLNRYGYVDVPASTNELACRSIVLVKRREMVLQRQAELTIERIQDEQNEFANDTLEQRAHELAMKMLPELQKTVMQATKRDRDTVAKEQEEFEQWKAAKAEREQREEACGFSPVANRPRRTTSELNGSLERFVEDDSVVPEPQAEEEPAAADDAKPEEEPEPVEVPEPTKKKRGRRSTHD